MSWTKRALVAEAFGELALSSYDFDISPDEQQAALRRLDGMMATWNAQGMVLGYAFGATPPTDLDQSSNLPLEAVEAVYLNLAVRIAAGKGKALAQSTKTNALAAYNALAKTVVEAGPSERQFRRGTPAGAGNRSWYGGGLYRPFLAPPGGDPAADDDANLFGA